MPSSAPTALGRGGAVAGHHHDAKPLAVELLDCLRGARLDRVGDAEHSGELAVDSDQHHRLPFAAQLLGALLRGRGIDPEHLQQPGVAERHRSITDPTAHASAGDRLEVSTAASW